MDYNISNKVANNRQVPNIQSATYGRVVEGRIPDDYNHEAMNYGSMMPSALMSKYEETQIDDDEMAYDNYARKSLSNWGPETPSVAADDRRGSVNKSAGMIQLRTDGHRGNVDIMEVYRPEHFDGFAGVEDQDPRGIIVAPDMDLVRKQEQARMRFQRMDPDMCEQITGGGVSQSQMMALKQDVFRATRDNLKIFDRQLDGRREGMRREYANISPSTGKQIVIQSYGDKITDRALNPQRKVTIMGKKILKDTRAYRDQTADGQFEIALYGQLGRRRRNKTNDKRVEMGKASTDNKFDESDPTVCYKAAGVLMSNIVRTKKTIHKVNKSNQDLGISKMSVAGKTAPYQRDLALILSSIDQDGKFAASDHTSTYKTAKLERRQQQITAVNFNHSAPAHTLINAELMYKSVKGASDMQKIREQMVTDTTQLNTNDIKTTAYKTAKMYKNKSRLSSADYDTDRAAEKLQTKNYRSYVGKSGDKRIRLASMDFTAESDNTQTRAQNRTNYRNETTADTERMQDYGDNLSKERKLGALGGKYLRRQMDRDSDADNNNMGELG